MLKSLLLFTSLCIFVVLDLCAQDAPPSRESFFINSKLKFRQRDLEAAKVFLNDFKNVYGATEAKYKKHLELVDLISKKEEELKLKPKKSKQDNSFLKISSCLQDVLSLGPKKAGSDPFNIDDCYAIHRVRPMLFLQSIEGKKLNNISDLSSSGDDLSKLVHFIDNNIVDKSSQVAFNDYLEALERKNKLENGGIDKIKEKIHSLEQEKIHREKFDRMVEEKLMNCKTELKLPLNDFSTVKPSSDNAFEVANDLLMTVTNDYKVSGHTYYSVDRTDVKDIFTSVTFKGYCTDKPKHDPLESCLDEKSDLEKIVSIAESCQFKEENAKNLEGISCLSLGPKTINSPNDKKQELENLRRTVVTNLAQGLSVGAKIGNIHKSIIGIKEEKGVCRYLIRDFSKKESSWVNESDVFEKMDEINSLVRYTRPEH
jgi:hypothetical protein